MPNDTVGQAAPDARGTEQSSRAWKRAIHWLVALALFAAFAWLFTRPARLFDADSYLHLALARAIAAHGWLERLDWARFSTLGQTYGDKELLFHLLLVPFVRLFDPELGGKLAQALLCAALAFSVWRIGTAAVGRHGWLLAALVFGSGSFALRALRLRPELLAVLLLVWIVWALARERHWLAGLLSAAFALAHTAFHSLLGLSVALLVWFRVSERRWNWQLLAAVWLGVACGVVLHPQFPDNLAVFWVQNVDFFRLRAQLDVGGEFQPHTTFDLLQLDGIFWLGLAAMVVARTPEPAPQRAAQRMAASCTIAALAFGLLFAQMGRFATLFIPFAALATGFQLRARGYVLGPKLGLPAGRAIPSWLAWVLLAALSCANLAAVALVNWRIAGSFDAGERRELDGIGRVLPPRARVAASWNDAELYAFHAPHAEYLNIYDPVFMAVGDPARHALWTEILAGRLPDIPGAIAGPLDSEYLAFEAAGRDALAARLRADPRAKLLHRGRHVVFRIDPNAAGFVTEWAFERGGGRVQADAYVDARAGLDASGCATITHLEPEAEPRPRLFEIAAWGPTIVLIDGQQRVQLPAAGEAVLGRGVAIAIRADERRWTVRTCAHAGHAGFYWVLR